MRADDERLVAFGTRNTYSEGSTDPKRGVLWARNWIAGRFREIAKSSGGRMSVALDEYVQPKTEDAPRAVLISSVVATLRGDDPSRGVVVISSHFDSRNSDGNDATKDAPGADDNGSAVVQALEAARLLAPHHFPATIVFAAYDAEEQGLWGSAHHAQMLHDRGMVVEADLNSDIIGSPLGRDGQKSPDTVRVFSEALPPGATRGRVNGLGSENDSPSRELARYAKETGERYVPRMTVEPIYHIDRFHRGGDHMSFLAQGFPAVRFTEPHENFSHQHQDVRVENGEQFGDLLQFVDFDYLARVAQINIATAASIALAPPRPAAKMDNRELGYDTRLYWDAVPGAASYAVVWRRTTESLWTHERNVGNVTSTTLAGLQKDDYIFGVRSVSAAGNESVVSFAEAVSR